MGNNCPRLYQNNIEKIPKNNHRILLFFYRNQQVYIFQETRIHLQLSADRRKYHDYRLQV